MHKLSVLAIGIQVAACVLAVVLLVRDEHSTVLQIVVIALLLAGWVLTVLGRRLRRSRPPVIPGPELDAELRDILSRDGQTAAVTRLRRAHRDMPLLQALAHIQALDPEPPARPE